MREKLVCLQKQSLKYTGGLIALTIHATILTTFPILTLPYAHHNNVLESKAIDTVIYTYCKEKISVHVRVMCDNVTAIAYVNTMGGIKSEPGNNIACRIWYFCIENKFLVSAAHIPSKNNVEADQQSRILQDATEWKLHPGLFPKIVDNFFFNMNCFSSSINTMIQYKDS